MVKLNGLDAFLAKCDQVRSAIPNGTRAGIMKAALDAKKTILNAAQARGWQPKGWVGYNIYGSGETTFATVSLRGAKAYWAQRGTEPHTIQGKDKPLNTPYGPRWSVNVKGAKARPFWEEGVAAASPLVARDIGAGIGAELGKLFGG